MAKLKDISTLATAKPKKSRKEIPTTRVEGDVVRRYNEACDQMARAEAVCKELSPELTEVGMEMVFQHNCTPGNKPINSYIIVDGEDDESKGTGSVMFTWQRKAKACDPKVVEAFFGSVKTRENKAANVNDYAGWTPVASFDAKVFLVVDKTGKPKFSQERYDAFLAAIQAVAEQFQVPNPLSCTKAFGPQPDFQERRFKDFDAETNISIAEVLPTSTSLEPVRSDEDEAEGA